jgi:hypothetical protein
MKIEFLGGERIDRACEKLVASASEHGETVSGDFNGIELVAEPGSTTADELSRYYTEEMRRRHEAYRASPECAAREQEAEEKRIQDRLDFALAIQDAPAIELRDESGWNEHKAANTDPYGAGVLRYAENWARIMQKRIAAGESVAEAAKASQFISDPEGITGFMYGCAVAALCAFWVHGEELRRWHNLETQIGSEGEKANESGAVLNPAVLNLG